MPVPRKTRGRASVSKERLPYSGSLQHKQLPVIDAMTGKIVGTVHQGDLLKVFMRPPADIRQEIVDDLAQRGFPARGVTVGVEDGVVTLSGQVALRSQVAPLVAAVAEAEGVEEVREAVTFQDDDLAAAALPCL
ncbi:BON domain-containing protein [Planomonospora sp. ID67723]|uniref:BON domain-containing protein n=1 Tax=Planomonospora sp. ID67723 TaxID=2738134 RepID=UPI0018C44FA4|nr:BON domain-containing protein [Planomonospora sp. ID67723]MBG0830098.1 BON domain-containing protein [Planomonospora sp. ID67723]